MARPKKARFVYSQDMAGLWLYIVEGDNYHLVTDRPIVNPETAAIVKAACSDDKVGLLQYRALGVSDD